MTMKLNLFVDNSVFKAVLYKNQCVTDFISLLPMALILGDYNREERSSRLPRRLSTDEIEDGVNIAAGDILAKHSDKVCGEWIIICKVGR